MLQSIPRERVLILTAFAAGVLVVLLTVMLGLLWALQAGSILPNTSVAGIDVSRQTPEQAHETLAPLAAARESDPVVLTLDDRRFDVVPENVGYGVDIGATIDTAMARGREGFLGDIFVRVGSLRSHQDVPLIDNYDRDGIRARVQDIAAEVDRDISPGSITVDPDDLTVAYELPHGSIEVLQDETVELLVTALNDDGADELVLPVVTQPQLISDANVRSVAEHMEWAMAEPLELIADGDETLRLTPEQLREVLTIEEHGSDDDTITLALEVSVSGLNDALADEDLDRFSIEPRNASYSASRAPPTTFDVQGSGSFSPVSANVELDPGQDGTRFDIDLAAAELTELLDTRTRTGELQLETVTAEFPADEAERLKPTHLLGTFTTYHAAGRPRVHNIQLLADTINHTVLLPGEQFSINGISGPRSCAKGYQEDGMILRGELVPVCGGGTSQLGTTTFNAAFFAGVQLDAWKAHSWYFTRYPMGREATLNFPDLDVRFTNTTPGAVILTTSHTATSITVSLYGQPIAQTVSARHGSPTSPTEPEEQREETDELCDDEERVKQDGFGGFTVQVTRVVDLIDGGDDSQVIRTVYVPQDRIIEEGTRDCSPPDEEEPDEEEPHEEEPDEEEPGDVTSASDGEEGAREDD